MLIYFVLGFLASLLLTPWVIKLAQKFDVIQYPPDHVLAELNLNKDDVNIRHKIIAAKRRLLKPPTPLWGGIAYIVPFIVISLGVLIWSKQINIGKENLGAYAWWFLGLLFLFILGLVDDKLELEGKKQFVIHLIAATIFALSPFDLRFVNSPFGGQIHFDWFTISFSFLGLPVSFVIIGDLILIVWIIAMLLALKMQAGTDGLMEGNTAIAAFIIFLVSMRFHQYASALFAIILAGVLLGFLVYNFHPAYIFSGSAGKSVMGYLIATLSVISGAKLAVAFIVFSIPLLDMVYVIFRRIVTHKLYMHPKRLINLFSISDRLHLHYRLMKLGFSEVQIALIEYAVTLIIGLGALFLVGKAKILFLAFSWIVIMASILYVNYKADLKHKHEILAKKA